MATSCDDTSSCKGCEPCIDVYLSSYNALNGNRYLLSKRKFDTAVKIASIRCCRNSLNNFWNYIQEYPHQYHCKHDIFDFQIVRNGIEMGEGFEIANEYVDQWLHYFVKIPYATRKMLVEMREIEKFFSIHDSNEEKVDKFHELVSTKLEQIKNNFDIVSEAFNYSSDDAVKLRNLLQKIYNNDCCTGYREIQVKVNPEIPEYKGMVKGSKNGPIDQ